MDFASRPILWHADAPDEEKPLEHPLPDFFQGIVQEKPTETLFKNLMDYCMQTFKYHRNIIVPFIRALHRILVQAQDEQQAELRRECAKRHIVFPRLPTAVAKSGWNVAGGGAGPRKKLWTPGKITDHELSTLPPPFRDAVYEQPTNALFATLLPYLNTCTSQHGPVFCALLLALHQQIMADYAQIEAQAVQRIELHLDFDDRPWSDPWAAKPKKPKDRDDRKRSLPQNLSSYIDYVLGPSRDGSPI